MKEQELIQLESQIKSLREWKDSIVRERFKYPLDIETNKILNRTNITFTGKIHNLPEFLVSDLIGRGLIFGTRRSIKRKVVLGILPVYPFTAVAVNNTIVDSEGVSRVENDDRVLFATSDTLPATLDEFTSYYVISRTATTFKVSLTSGGAEVNITDTGIGTHYYSKA